MDREYIKQIKELLDKIFKEDSRDDIIAKLDDDDDIELYQELWSLKCVLDNLGW